MSKDTCRDMIAEIESLPSGGITLKKINGKEYAYYQWREDGKQRSRRAKDEELDLLTEQIERRKELQNLVKESEFQYIAKSTINQFRCVVRMDEQLNRFVKPVTNWKKRELYQSLHDSMIFSTKRSTDEYVDSAIARNIQHSLKNYQHEGHFRSLQDLYEKNELTSVINRIVEDMNHRFTLEVLTRDFASNDLHLSAKNLRKDRENPTDILDYVDFPMVNAKLKTLLEIRNKNEPQIDIQDAHRIEIKEYLDLLDLTVDIEIRWMSDYNRREIRTAFCQPGMRYSQAEALIKVLMEENTLGDVKYLNVEQYLNGLTVESHSY